MPGHFVIKRRDDGKYVARYGAEHSYTNDRKQAAEFDTAKAASDHACGNESVWYEPRGYEILYPS